MSIKRLSPSGRRSGEIVAEVGGPVDETHVTLGIYGPDVRPDEISAVLGCTPTSAHRRGDSRGPGQPLWPQSAWLLTVVGTAPVGPNEVLQQLLVQLPEDPVVWKELASKHTVRVTFGIFAGGWNQGFEFAPASVKRLAGLGIAVAFDVYADADDAGSD